MKGEGEERRKGEGGKECVYDNIYIYIYIEYQPLDHRLWTCRRGSE